MASISDVFDALNDVKGKLDQLHADNLNHNVLIEATNTKLDALDQSVASLETTLDGRLLSMLQEQQLGNQLLLHLTKQQETVICGIEQISRNTCTLVNLASEQLVETRHVRENTRVPADILSSAHPDAALDLSRRDRLQEQIEECCPPKPSEPICRYEPCKDPGPFKEPRKPKRGPD